MSIQNIERLHATALSKITEFVNFECIVLHKTNPKFKLSNSQALEYTARIRGFNTRKGAENKTSTLSQSELKENFKSIFDKQFGSVNEEGQLNRLFEVHNAYLESQEWNLEDVLDPHTAFAFTYINNATWNAVAAAYLSAQPDDWDDGLSKPQLLLSHLFTANAISHMTDKSEEGYDFNESTFLDLSKPIPNENLPFVISGYQSLSKSCFEIMDLDQIMTTRELDYLIAKANGEFDSAQTSQASKLPDLKNKHYTANKMLKDLSIDHIYKTSKRTNFIFNIPHNIPNLAFAGDTFEHYLGQLRNLNLTIRDSDYVALSLCTPDFSLNAWNYYLINYYNAALDFSAIIFRQLAPSERFDFNNVFFDDFGRVFYKTSNAIKTTFMNKEYLLSENDFSVLFSFLISNQIVTERNLPFNLYMNFYNQLMIHNTLKYRQGVDDFQLFQTIKLS